jgi:hypothetical protein
MRAAAWLVRRRVEELPRLRRGARVRDLDVVTSLDDPQVRAQLVLVEQQAVADAELRALLPGEEPLHRPQIDDGVLRYALRLAVEEVGNGGHGVELEGLVGVELEFHLSGQISSLFELVLKISVLVKCPKVDIFGRKVCTFGQAIVWSSSSTLS